jgi:hypothetical protein
MRNGAVTWHIFHVDRNSHMAALTTGFAPGAHGRLELFDTSGSAAGTAELWHRWQTPTNSTAPSNGWSGRHSFDTPQTATVRVRP